MIVSQWRECIAIKRQWEKGTLKHRLVSYVMDTPKGYFYRYVWDITQEMKKRNIKFQEKYLNEISIFTEGCQICSIDQHYLEHNNRYLIQCLYNLEEKAMRNIISKDEWLKIYNKFKDFTDLWEGE